MNLYNFHSNPEELNGYEEKVFIVPSLAYEFLRKMQRQGKIIDRDDEIENTLSKHPRFAYLYARNFLHSRFKEGEPAILTSPEWATEYCLSVIKGPWKEAEKTIARDARASVIYAALVLGTPFPLGEKAIRKEQEYSSVYDTFLDYNRVNPGVMDSDDFEQLW